MERLKRILAVIDPTQDTQFSLVKALLLARKTNAEVIAYLCDYIPHEDMAKATSLREGRKAFIAERKAWLEKITTPYHHEDIRLTTKMEYSKFWYTGILRAAIRERCDLIVKATQKHSKTKRVLTKTSDFMLIRRSPCPVLLAHHATPWTQGITLAALDLESDDEGHFRLNNSIMHRAHMLYDLFGMDVYIVSACNPHGPIPQLAADYLDENETAAEQVGYHFGVPTSHVLLRDGTATDVISAAVDELNVDLVIMGSMGRQGLKGVIIGNTAERLLDSLECDVLTIS